MASFLHTTFRRFAAITLLAGTAHAAATATMPPPPAELKYDIVAHQSGLRITGNAQVQWQHDRTTYQLTSRTNAMIIGKILETSSKGRIASDGLQPESFVEQHFRKGESQTLFDRTHHKITFTRSDNKYDLHGGEQDRSSIVWQLAALGRSDSKALKPGTELSFFVAGQRDADPWTFRVIGKESVSTPSGTHDTLRISRGAPGDNPAEQLDIWLAPGEEWYPVKVRFVDENNDSVEQTLAHITRTGK